MSESDLLELAAVLDSSAHEAPVFSGLAGRVRLRLAPDPDVEHGEDEPSEIVVEALRYVLSFEGYPKEKVFLRPVV